jgi:hypothetical protein
MCLSDKFTREGFLADSTIKSGDVNFKKYQQLPAQFGMVSVSRFASPPQFGHAVFTKSLIFDNGDSPVPVGS